MKKLRFPKKVYVNNIRAHTHSELRALVLREAEKAWDLQQQIDQIHNLTARRRPVTR